MLTRLLLPLAVAAIFSGAACAQADKQIGEQVDEPALYDMLLGEIALQRGDYALAAKTYLELAKQTGDPRVARRAVEVANQGKLTDLAIEAAPRDFDFRELRHERLLLVRGTKYT